MATEKSTLVSNAQASPPVVGTNRGLTITTVDTMEVSDGAAADVAILSVRLPVDAILPSVKIATDDFGTSTTMDVGLYLANADGTFTAISAACIGSAIDVATAAVALTEIRFETKNIDTVKKKVWEIAGLSARPAYGELYLGVSFPAETTAAGTVSVITQHFV